MASNQSGAFDILSTLGKRRNEKFLVTFDWYTPRSHFIIKPRNDIYDNLQDKSLTDLERPNHKNFLTEVIDTARSAAQCIRPNSSAILSFHRGMWISNYSPKFHAHVSVGVDEYFLVYDQCDAASHAPRTTWDTTSYKKQVRSYPSKGHYFQSDCDAIRRQKAVQFSSIPGLNVDALRAEFHDQIVFHPRIARVGFKLPGVNASPSTGQFLELLLLMEKFAVAARLASYNTGRIGGELKYSLGCHLCISLTGALQDFGLPSVYGYVQMSSQLYYDLLPRDQKQRWFTQFSSLQDVRDQEPMT